MAEGKVRARVFISGKVQGVFYRSWTKQKAQKLNLTGWVRNLSDGRVEALFEGTKKSVTKMLEYCKDGSNVASVTRLEVKWETPTEEYKNFTILATG